MMSPRRVMQDDRKCMELQSCLENKYQYDSLIRDRKAMLAKLDNEILELEKKILRQNQIVAKVEQANSSKRLQKQIETLEMRLNNVTVHFDTILTRNSELREEIESLRIQKAALDNSYLKLRKKLDQQRRRMNTAIKRSAQAYKQRMEVLAKISAMKETHSKDIVQYNVELQERERVLHQENKLKAFAIAKFTDRSELEEQAKKKKALKAAQRAKQSQGESFGSRVVAYNRLLELTEDGNIDHLLNSFIEKEEKNFACFKYITELNNEMEKIQWKIKDLQNEITALVADQKYAESNSLHDLKELEERLMQTTEKANWEKNRCEESNKVLDQLKSNMETVIKGIDCDATKTTKQLGENWHITDLNLMQFLGILEKMTTELLLKESILRYTLTKGSRRAQPLTNPLLGSTELLRTMDRARLCPPPPVLNSTANAVNALEVPLDHGQLRQLILQRQEKKRGSAAGTGKKGVKV
ncbi:coiled-coil domain-containing protein 63 [Balearica regulorum gibbericeps]|uniref:coiled-coil domain-containing protein 63 n=1 Tax=Balearica regulorum gibbericeps TaxID=100784 RepID=UPI003F62011F